MIQATITRKGFLNHFKLRHVDDIELKTWVQRNITPLSQIVWVAYEQGRFKERMVGTNIVRQLEIDIDKFAGWAFV